MNDIPLGLLFGALVVLLLISAFFSGSETGLMSLNRYRLRHLANQGQRDALRAQKLLEKPDRLIGLILLGNNLVNIMASSLATIIAVRLLGDAGIAVAVFALTLVVLIVSEVAPKTLAALHPERVAFPASRVLAPLLTVFYPVVYCVNIVAGALLRLVGLQPRSADQSALSAQELRTVVMEAGAMIPKRHQTMLLSILDLEDVTVEDIMVPRNEVRGVDLNDDWDTILDTARQSPYSRLLVYRDHIDNVVGVLHLRKLGLLALHDEALTRSRLESLIREPYFIPEGTGLNTQLLNFQKERRRMGLVVDEYGDLLGLVTLEDILEEIVGEFTTDPSTGGRQWIHPSSDGFEVDASISVRALNRALNCTLPIDGPRTLNGLIMEALEAIPEPGARLTLGGHDMEILRMNGNRIRAVRMWAASDQTGERE